MQFLSREFREPRLWTFNFSADSQTAAQSIKHESIQFTIFFSLQMIFLSGKVMDVMYALSAFTVFIVHEEEVINLLFRARGR